MSGEDGDGRGSETERGAEGARESANGDEGGGDEDAAECDLDQQEEIAQGEAAAEGCGGTGGPDGVEHVGADGLARGGESAEETSGKREREGEEEDGEPGSTATATGKSKGGW